MTIKIGFVGAPGSGKTTLAAQMYSDLLKYGCATARLVPEFAQEFLGAGETINQETQPLITLEQTNREIAASSAKFSPLVCDSAIWLGAIYAEYSANVNNLERTKEFEEYLEATYASHANYDYIVYVPLFDNTSKTNAHRIHDEESAKAIDVMIRDFLNRKHNDKVDIWEAPTSLGNRTLFSYELAVKIAKITARKAKQKQ